MEVTVLVEYRDDWRYMYMVYLSGNFVCRINPMECSVVFVFDQEFTILSPERVLPIGMVETTRAIGGPGMGSRVWGVRVTLYVEIGCRPVSLRGEETGYTQSVDQSYINRAHIVSCLQIHGSVVCYSTTSYTTTFHTEKCYIFLY